MAPPLHPWERERCAPAVRDGGHPSIAAQSGQQLHLLSMLSLPFSGSRAARVRLAPSKAIAQPIGEVIICSTAVTTVGTATSEGRPELTSRADENDRSEC